LFRIEGEPRHNFPEKMHISVIELVGRVKDYLKTDSCSFDEDSAIEKTVFYIRKELEDHVYTDSELDLLRQELSVRC
jgi:hypothetical protein